MFGLIQVMAASLFETLSPKAPSQNRITIGNHMLAQACATAGEMLGWLKNAATSMIEDWNKGIAEGKPNVTEHQVSAAIWSMCDSPIRHLRGFGPFVKKVSARASMEYYQQLDRLFSSLSEALASLPELQNPTPLMSKLLANEKHRAESWAGVYRCEAEKIGLELKQAELIEGMKETTHIVDSTSPENAGIAAMLGDEPSLNPNEDIDLTHDDDIEVSAQMVGAGASQGGDQPEGREGDSDN